MEAKATTFPTRTPEGDLMGVRDGVLYIICKGCSMIISGEELLPEEEEAVLVCKDAAWTVCPDSIELRLRALPGGRAEEKKDERW